MDLAIIDWKINGNHLTVTQGQDLTVIKFGGMHIYADFDKAIANEMLAVKHRLGSVNRLFRCRSIIA